MMKNDKGITLTALILTIVILSIIIGVSLQFNYTSITEIRDNNQMAQLGIVRQAIVERYEQAAIVNQIKKKSNPEYWIGQIIIDFNNVNLPDKSTIVSNASIETFYGKKTNYSCTYPEDYYYRLDPQALSRIGITDAKDTYIVNYSTGEVYNEAKKTTNEINENGKIELLYLPPVNYVIEESTEDMTSFNDWAE